MTEMTTREQALARLAASRSDLQREMTGPHGARDLLAQQGMSPAGPWRGRLSAWWRWARWHARRQPLMGPMVEAAEQWWHHHPWRTPGELALLEVRTQLAPLVQRHPWASMALSAAVGASLMAGRPWRHRWVAQQMQPLPGRVSGWLIQEIRRLPLQALVTRLLVAAAGPAPGSAASAASTASATSVADAATAQAPHSTV